MQHVVMHAQFASVILDASDYRGAAKNCPIGPLLSNSTLMTLHQTQNHIFLFVDDCTFTGILHQVPIQGSSKKLSKNCTPGQLLCRCHLTLKTCNVMTISYQRYKSILEYRLWQNILMPVNSCPPHLGVIISFDLRRSTHIDSSCSMTSRTLNFIRRNTIYHCFTESKSLAYNLSCKVARWVRSLCMLNWNPAKECSQLEMVQRGAACFVERHALCLITLNWTLLDSIVWTQEAKPANHAVQSTP